MFIKKLVIFFTCIFYHHTASPMLGYYGGTVEPIAFHCLQGHTDQISALGVTKFDKHYFVVSASWDKTLRIWDPHSKKCTRVLKGHYDKVNALATCFTHDNIDENNGAGPSIIVSGSSDKTVKMWNPENSDCIATLVGHTAPVLSIEVCAYNHAINPYIASGDESGKIIIWNLESNTEQISFCHDDMPVKFLKNICLDRSAQTHKYLLASASDTSVKIWDAYTGQCLHTFEVVARESGCSISGLVDCPCLNGGMPSDYFMVSTSGSCGMYSLWSVLGKCFVSWCRDWSGSGIQNLSGYFNGASACCSKSKTFSFYDFATRSVIWRGRADSNQPAPHKHVYRDYLAYSTQENNDLYISHDILGNKTLF